jgi:hypothetical protein
MPIEYSDGSSGNSGNDISESSDTESSYYDEQDGQ